MAFDARLPRDDPLEVLVFAVLFFDRPVVLRLALLRRLLEQDLHGVVILGIARSKLARRNGGIALKRLEEGEVLVFPFRGTQVFHHPFPNRLHLAVLELFDMFFENDRGRQFLGLLVHGFVDEIGGQLRVDIKAAHDQQK